MEKEKYLEMRNGLYNEAEKLINEGKIEEGQAKMQEITDLDNKFDNEAQRVLLNSKEESRKLKHKYISTEHFVLSLLSFDNKISKTLKTI